MGMTLKPRCSCRSGWGMGLLNQKKAWISWSKFKVMLVVFFDWKGIVHHEFLSRGQMVNKYQEVLARLRDAVRRKSTELWENRTWMLHHDNALAQALLLIRAYLPKFRHLLCPIHPNLQT